MIDCPRDKGFWPDGKTRKCTGALVLVSCIEEPTEDSEYDKKTETFRCARCNQVFERVWWWRKK